MGASLDHFNNAIINLPSTNSGQVIFVIRDGRYEYH